MYTLVVVCPSVMALFMFVFRITSQNILLMYKDVL